MVEAILHRPGVHLRKVLLLPSKGTVFLSISLILSSIYIHIYIDVVVAVKNLGRIIDYNKIIVD